jgi:Flagellin and related hook-associated proteins
MNVGDDDVIYLSDTGELLLGANVYKELSGLVDDPLTNSVNEGEIRVTYQKSDFKEGDLKPEHYFYCVASGEDGKLGITPDNPKPAAGSPEAAEAADNIVYNPTYLTNNAARQVIEYDVGYNQRIQVNTIAEEAFNPSVTREVDDMIQALERLQKIEGITTTLKGMLDKESDPAKQKVIQDQLDAANKAFTYEKEVVQKKFSSGLTVMQGFLNEVNVAVTGCGARGSRLDLVSNRLSSQKSTFEILKSENEDVDLSEAVVQLTSAENTYEAALKATGKVMQVNLMDFI